MTYKTAKPLFFSSFVVVAIFGLLALNHELCVEGLTVHNRPTTTWGGMPQHDEFSKNDETPPKQAQHIVLIGGGHAHVQVIKALNKASRSEHVTVTLIDALQSASYSGMVPGCVAGLYTPEETQIHLEQLAQWAGISFVHDRVVDIDFERKLVYTRHGDNPISFDLVSIDIGSTSRGLDSTPGAREFTIPTRPIHKLVSRLEDARQELVEEDSNAPPPRLVVIGGGAAGIELSLVISSRWQELGVKTTVLDSGSCLVPDESCEARNKLMDILFAKGIEVRHHSSVKEISENSVTLLSGQEIRFTHCVWATGAEAHRLAFHLSAVRGLATTKRGWIRVGPTLQSVSHPYVFAAGDCASIEGLERGASPPKAGVFAVRAGPVLVENMARYLNDGNGDSRSTSFVEYTPQDDFLKLLMCGDGMAFGLRFGLPLYGKWVFELKDHIDRSFMRLFQVDPKESQLDGEHSNDQYDAEDIRKLEAQPRLSAEDAATLLLQSPEDGQIDYMQAWKIIRAMAEDAKYRAEVLQFAASPVVLR